MWIHVKRYFKIQCVELSTLYTSYLIVPIFLFSCTWLISIFYYLFDFLTTSFFGRSTNGSCNVFFAVTCAFRKVKSARSFVNWQRFPKAKVVKKSHEALWTCTHQRFPEAKAKIAEMLFSRTRPCPGPELLFASSHRMHCKPGLRRTSCRGWQWFLISLHHSIAFVLSIK
jgi:hypothetical protein